MKNIVFLFIIIMLLSLGCKTTKPVASSRPEPVKATVAIQTVSEPDFNFSDPSTFILGFFAIDKLKQSPYSSWFIKGYDDYSINSEALNKLLDISKENLKLKIVMGTWCPDSRREVPRLMRVLDIWRFPLSQVILIGVDKSKKADVSEFESLNIQRVPTFILYKNNIEAGRIIENPVTSLEQDIVNILNKNEK